MPHRKIQLLFAIAAVLALTAGLEAQQRLDLKNLQKSSPKVLAAFQEVVAKPCQCTVRVKCNGQDTALGAIVAEDGWVLTKYSDLKGKIVCRLHDGRELEARMVGVEEKHDLAMLKIEASGLTPIRWAESKLAPVGNWVASPGTDGKPAAIGVISVASRNVAGKGAAPAPGANSGYLGVALDQDSPGVKVVQVLPKTGAEKAGIKVGDMVLSVNGEKVEDAEDFMATLQRRKPGDKITLKIQRGDQELELRAELGTRPNASRGDFQNSLGSKLSNRRSGFPVILQHDSVLDPTDCGGPLVDLEGRAIGLNIARAGRTETYAIPAEVVLPLIPVLRSGKLAPPVVARPEPKEEPAPAPAPGPAAGSRSSRALTPEEMQQLNDARSALQRAEQDLAEAQRRFNDARSFLERLQSQLNGAPGRPGGNK
jgi:serine protease Do